MPPFQYQPFVNPYAASIGDLLLRRGDIEANRAMQIANAQARAAEASGQAWAGAFSNIGQMVAGIPQQIQQQKRTAQDTELRALQLGEAKRDVAGRTALSNMMSMQGREQQGPTQSGEPLPPLNFMKQEGGATLWDTGKVEQYLGRIPGLDVPSLMKHVHEMNDAHLEEAQRGQAYQQSQVNALARTAGGTRATIASLVKAGLPLDQAVGSTLDMIRPLLIGNGRKPEQVDQILQGLKSNPEHADAFLQQIESQSSEKGQIVPEGGTLVTPSGNPITTGPPKPITPERAKVEAYIGSLGLPNGTAWEALSAQQRAGFPAWEKSQTQGPGTLEEQYLTAVTKGDAPTAARILSTMKATAAAKRDPAATALAAELGALRKEEAQARLDARDVGSDANQGKFEQQYRTILARGLSSRSGGLGLEDQKVQQANHLLALLHQTYDPKTDTYTIPKTLQGELAAGLARLIAPGGTVGIEMMREFNQKTAKGDIAGALSYITGHPFPTATNDFAKLLKDSIERQGQVAEQNREGEMRYLRGLAPTDLNEERRTKLEANTLNPLRQSRLIQNKATGERKLQVSTDGGQTWK